MTPQIGKRLACDALIWSASEAGRSLRNAQSAVPHCGADPSSRGGTRTPAAVYGAPRALIPRRQSMGTNARRTRSPTAGRARPVHCCGPGVPDAGRRFIGFGVQDGLVLWSGGGGCPGGWGAGPAGAPPSAAVRDPFVNLHHRARR